MRSRTLPMTFVLATLVALPSVARADQCQLVDGEIATRALTALRHQPKVIQYCEPCGDRAPGEPVAADRVAKTRDVDGTYQVTIDRREVDLAYMYVQTGPSRYENVAALAGCPTSGVSPSLRVDDATPSGVMISADTTPVTHVQLPPAEPAPTAPEVTYVIRTESHTNWLAIILACGASSGMWAFAGVMVMRRRRNAAMRPRAVELVDRGE